jgi:hypothetical protein
LLTETFPFEHEKRFALPLKAFGVSPERASVRLTDDRLQVRFGLFRVDTPLSNIKGVTVTGPFKFYKAVGPRLSLADRGATFGSTAAGGVCIQFKEPVKAMPPISSPGLTVTVADREGLAEALRRRTDAS